MPKDLKSKIDMIEESEKETSSLQAKVDRLTELVEKQKKVISDQNALLEEQKKKIGISIDLPDDVRELREIIGTQRALLNEKENELEQTKGLLIQAQKELQMTSNQMIPAQKKLEESFVTIGNLKADLAEKNSELVVKNEKLKSLENKTNELQKYVDKFQDEQVKFFTDVDSKYSTQIQGKMDTYMKQIEDLKIENLSKIDALNKRHMDEMEKKSEEKFKALENLRKEYENKIESLKTDGTKERQVLRSEISKMESILFDSKLISTEKTSEASDLASRFQEIKDKYSELINKVKELEKTKKVANDDTKRLTTIIDNLSNFKQENLAKINAFNKLTILMEQDPLFKAYLIVQDVGSISIEDLRNALGSPIVTVKKHIQKLQEIDLVEVNEAGKVSLKKSEES